MKSQRIFIRVSFFEKMLIQGKAKFLNLSISEYVRLCALDKRLPCPKSEQELEIYNTLVQYHTHFRRISNLIKNKNKPKLYSELQELMKQLKAEIQKW